MGAVDGHADFVHALDNFMSKTSQTTIAGFFEPRPQGV